jgi:Alginate export
MKTRPGFIAALDQSGGSTPGALRAYGIKDGVVQRGRDVPDCASDAHAHHDTPAFTAERILAAILFENTVDRDVEGHPTADYLWNTKRIVPFLKVDKGLAAEKSGVQLMRPIPDLAALLDKARAMRIFGTKMRSLVKQANGAGIKDIVTQQFELARQIIAADLVPIVEPEVDIHCLEKARAEELLKAAILAEVDRLPADHLVMLKLTLPEKDDLYADFVKHPRVVRVGAEARLRYEWIEANNWGEGPAADDGYLWYRALPYADLHAGPYLRIFGQLVAAFAEDKEPSVTPVDETGVDLLQGFLDLTLLVTSAVSVTLRGGRQMLLYGSERLIGTRYGPNVPRSFDGFKGLVTAGAWKVDAFYVRPVAVGLKSFDDDTSNRRSLWALYATRTLPVGDKAGVDAYYIGYQAKDAVFNQGAGDELRHTLGARLFGGVSVWDWNLEGFYQFGDFADGRISAWSVASYIGFTFTKVPLRPRVGLKANIISGDEDPDDRDLQTFNALFPKGKYFGELSLLGPYNLINLHPSIGVALGAGWSLSVASVFYWRESTGDGIYDVAGNLIRGDQGSLFRTRSFIRAATSRTRDQARLSTSSARR